MSQKANVAVDAEVTTSHYEIEGHPGHTLCGLSFERFTSYAPGEAKPFKWVSCPLCELANLLDGIPWPQGEWIQPQLF